jgi:epoxide hydrolase
VPRHASVGNGSACARVQGTRPQTLGYSLSDSPVGQAAWIYEKLDQWSDPNDALSPLRDETLDNIMLYWLSNTGASSARLYFAVSPSRWSRRRPSRRLGRHSLCNPGAS